MTAAATEPWTTARHPLARLLRSVAAGQFPHQDGAWTRVSPWIPTLQAIVGFTGHSILAVSYDVSAVSYTHLDVYKRQPIEIRYVRIRALWSSAIDVGTLLMEWTGLVGSFWRRNTTPA